MGCCAILEVAVNQESKRYGFLSLGLILDYIVPEEKEDPQEPEVTLEAELSAENIIVQQDPKESPETLEEEVEEDLTIDDLEEELDDITDDTPHLSYSIWEERLLAEQFYKNPGLDYMKLWYGETKPAMFQSEEEYFVEQIHITDTEAEILTDEEAEEALVSIQYATVTGTMHDVSCITRRKFDLWIKFNPALFGLFESLNGLTREVDYKPFA